MSQATFPRIPYLLRQQLLFFELEWINLDDAKAKAIIDDPAVAKFAHFLLPNLEKYNLDSLATHFNFPIGNRHRSIDDVELTIKVFLEVLKLYK